MDGLLLTTLRSIAAAGLYIFAISQLMFYGEHFFNKSIESLMPFMMLLLFTLSAAAVGSLVFGQAVMFFLGNNKAEGIKSAGYSIMWLFLISLAVVIILVIQ